MKKIISLTMSLIMFISLFGFDVTAHENSTSCIMYAPDGRTINIKTSEIEAYKKVGWYKSAFEAQIGFSFDDKLYNDITYVLNEEAKKDKDYVMKFCVGFVNDDNIPDVMTSFGGGVYIYILKDRKLHRVGSEYGLSQNGIMEYIPKKNRIYGAYGGTAFIPQFMDIENGQVNVIARLGQWHYICNYDDKEISLLEFWDLFDAYYNDGVEYVKADYETMHEISIKNVKSAFEEALSNDNSDKVKMYTPDGRTAVINSKDVQAWKNVGWYDYPVRTMYTRDGRSAVVAGKDLLAWVNVGWHTREGILMFSPQGTTAEVRLTDIEAWKAVGWYEYPVIRMYAIDGRSVVISKQKQEEWRKVGWYSEYEKLKMYAPDGRTADVSIKDVPSWKKVGWYEYPVLTMCTLDGRTAVVAGKDSSAWHKVGWYGEYDHITMYASDGRIEFVPAKEVPEWRKVGWHLNPQKSDETLKREAWNLTVQNIKDRLYVPGSGVFPDYASGNVTRSHNSFSVYIDYTALNRFGVRVRGRYLFTVELCADGYVIRGAEDLLD